jgi:hypothetical protein
MNEIQDQKISHWMGMLRGWKVLEWPVVAGLLTALFIFFGYVADNGRRSVLGTDFLDRPTISVNYAITGIGQLLGCIFIVGVFAIIFFLLRKLLQAVVRRIMLHSPRALIAPLTFIKERVPWGWVVSFSAFVISIYGFSIGRDVIHDLDGTLVKPMKELGSVWMHMGLTNDPELGYALRLGITMIIFAPLSWWVVRSSSTNRPFRAMFCAWAATITFYFFVMFVFILGATSSLQSHYPVVALTNMEQFGKNIVSILLDSDDKGYAFLLLTDGRAADGTSSPSKMIVYFPRQEVKGFAVLRKEPLYDLIRVNELRAALPPANKAE